jgi:hypothetical protein
MDILMFKTFVHLCEDLSVPLWLTPFPSFNLKGSQSKTLSNTKDQNNKFRF